jgi:GT2 family glycosyltransferase
LTPSPLSRDRGSESRTSENQIVPLVVSIVVNYGGLDDTRQCVASVLASSYEHHSVVVVDNASPSGDADRLLAEFGGRVRVIASRENLGYGGGANLGLRWALDHGAAYAWVLNNDTVVDPGCIEMLVDGMESNPGLGVLSPQILCAVGPDAPSGVWFSGGSLQLGKARARHSRQRLTGTSIAATEFVTGCAMFVRCSALTGTGLFWEPLFLYWEDVDLSVRMRRAGWKLGVVPNALIQHRVHGSIGAWTQDYYYFRNALIVVRRCGSRSAAITGLYYLTAGVVRRWARALCRRRPAPTGATRGLLAAIVPAFRWPADIPLGPRRGE